MTNLLQRDKKAARPLDKDEASGLRSTLGRVIGLDLDFARLSAEEQRELVALANKSLERDVPREPGVRRHPDLDRLGRRDRKRFERLVEQAADRPGAFQHERDLGEMRAVEAELHKAAVMPPRAPRFEREGALVLPPECLELIRRLPPISAAIYVAVLASLASAETPGAPRSRIEPGPVLVVNNKYGLWPASSDPKRTASGWRKALDGLSKRIQGVSLLDVEKRGQEIWIRAGNATLAWQSRREAS